MSAQFLRDVFAGTLIGLSIGFVVCLYAFIERAHEAPGTAYVGSVHIPPLKAP